jgi:hypothetical protein
MAKDDLFNFWPHFMVDLREKGVAFTWKAIAIEQQFPDFHLMAMLQGAGLDGKVLSSAWNVVGFW